MKLHVLCLFAFILNFSHAYEVLTISDSIVDHILYVDDEFVSSLDGKKGGSCLVEDAVFQKIITESKTAALLRPGSSGVNTVKGLQKLGHDCALITTIGSDQEGDFFLKSLSEQGITLFLQHSSVPTGKSACLVTASGERTMRTFLGASKANDRLNLSPEMFKGISHFHFEGYQLKHQRLVKQAVDLAKQNGATVSLDLSSFEVVNANKKFIWELLENKQIDILFANQEEAAALTELQAKDASQQIAEYCTISVVTMGEKGCYVSQKDSQWQCPALKVKAIDTIGAGDLFTSGFLHGFLTHQPIPVCACFGTLLASHVIQHVGAEIPEDQWESIKTQINEKTLAHPVRGRKHQG